MITTLDKKDGYQATLTEIAEELHGPHKTCPSGEAVKPKFAVKFHASICG
jgi:hypothetical protein